MPTLPPVSGAAASPSRPASAAARTGGAGASPLPRSLHPLAREVLQKPAPAGAASLVGRTNALAERAAALKEEAAAAAGAGAGAGGGGEDEDGDGGPEAANRRDCLAEPFRSLLDNAQGWGRQRVAVEAFMADASSTLAFAASKAARMGESDGAPRRAGAGAGTAGGGGAISGGDAATLEALHAPFPAGVERDPVLRAMLRLQRARVLSAAHAQGVVRAREEASARSAYAAAAKAPAQQQQQQQQSPPQSPRAPASPGRGDEDELSRSLQRTRLSGESPQRYVLSPKLLRSQQEIQRQRPSTAQARLGASSSSSSSSGHGSAAEPLSYDPLGYSQADLDRHVSVPSAKRVVLSRPGSAAPARAGARSPSPERDGDRRLVLSPRRVLPPVAVDVDAQPVLIGLRSVSAALSLRMPVSISDMAEAKRLQFTLHEAAAQRARERKRTTDAELRAKLARAAAVEAAIKNKAEFNRRVRELVTLVTAARGVLCFAMALNDEKERRRMARAREASAIKIGGWWHRCMQYRYVKSLEHSRKVIKRTLGRFIMRFRTLRYVRAAKIVARFLVATEGMGQQVRTFLAYKRYASAVRAVAEFLRRAKDAAAAQNFVMMRRFRAAEAERRAQLAKGFAAALLHGAEAAGLSARELSTMRALGMTSASTTLRRFEEARALLSGAADSDGEGADKDKAKAKGAAKAGKAKGDGKDGKDKGKKKKASKRASVPDAGSAAAAAAAAAAASDGGMTSAGEDAGGEPAPPPPPPVDPSVALEAAILFLLTPVPDYAAVPGVRSFLRYRRKEQADARLAARRRARGLADFLDAQRAQAEVVQRLMWKGPSSAFVFDEKALPAAPAPRRARALPTQAEVAQLAELLMGRHFGELSLLVRKGDKERAESELKAREEAEERKKKKKKAKPKAK